MRVTRLRIHPVKSLAGLDVGAAALRPWGFEGDRRWAVVEPDGTPLTAREHNAMLGLAAEPLAGGGVALSDPRGGSASATDPLVIDVPSADTTPIPVGHSRQGTALPAADEADSWLSARLDRPVRLVWQPDPFARGIAATHGGLAGDALSFADAGPLLVTTEASLAQLNAWTPDDVPPLDMLRFRPSLVIDGDVPFAEDGWQEIEVGGGPDGDPGVRLRFTEACDRCTMTRVDPVTLARGKEPIRTLAKHRKRDGATWFGIRMAPVANDPDAAPPVLRVGDEVRVVR